LSFGLAVIDLGTARKNGERRAARTLEITLALMRKSEESDSARRIGK
jgi:hypothetical protein